MWGMHSLHRRSRTILEVVAPAKARGSSKGEAGSLPAAAARSRPAQAEMGAWLTLLNGPVRALLCELSSILLMLQGFTSKSSGGSATWETLEKQSLAEKHLKEIDKNHNECDSPHDTGYLVSLCTPLSITQMNRGPLVTWNCLELAGVNPFTWLCPAVGHQTDSGHQCQGLLSYVLCWGQTVDLPLTIACKHTMDGHLWSSTTFGGRSRVWDGCKSVC